MTKRIHGTIDFKTLSAKTLVFHLVGPFRISKRLFLGPSFLGTLSRDLCARISNHTDLKNISHSIFIPLEPSIKFKTLSAKTLVFHLVGPFRIAKHPFLGPSFL